MKKNLTLLLLLILTVIIKGSAQTPNWLWAKSACALSAATSITSIATDPAGNIYIAGNFRDSALFGNTVFHPVGTVNMFIAKFDSAGNFVWMLPGSGNNVPPYNLVTDICTDSAGNCYFTGFFNGNIIMSHDTITSTNAQPDVFAGKITNGTIQWLQQGGGTGSDYAYGIGLDSDGNCYIGGSFDQAISFGNIALTSNTASYDLFVAKLDAGGNFISAHAAGGSGVDLMSSMAVDKNGNCFATGTFTSPEIIFGMDSLHYASSGADAYVAKFDSAGNSLWGRAASGPGSQEPYSIAADANGSCYVTGIFKADTMYIDTFTLVTYGYWDFFTAKYDSSGILAWAGHQGSSSFGPESSTGITADTAGNFYTTGFFRNPCTFDPITVTSPGAADIFVTRFNNAGAAEWVNQSGSNSGGLTATAIHMDGGGNIFITGSYEASTVIGTDSLVVLPGYTAGYFIAKLGIDSTTIGIQTMPTQHVLTLFPNPASETISILSTEKIESLSMYDMMGNKILHLDKFAESLLDVSDLSRGMYLLEINCGSTVVQRKFIKQ